jgi:CubicO group peptidase (beta-lactamase class C family)
VTPSAELAGVAPDGASTGYQWWTGRVPWRGRELAWGAAFGNGGQRIFVVPELDLGVVTTASDYGSIEIAIAVNACWRRSLRRWPSSEPGLGCVGYPGTP